jgi:hypothetical protein
MTSTPYLEDDAVQFLSDSITTRLEEGGNDAI